jgi:hypothetical protein
MHEPRDSGETLFQVLGRLTRLGDGPRVPWPAAERTSRDTLQTWRAHVETLRRALETIGPPGEHRLRGIGRTEWSFGLTDEARPALAAARAAAAKLRGTLESLAGACGPGGCADALTVPGARGVVQVAALLQRGLSADSRLLLDDGAAGRCAELRGLCAVGMQRDARRTDLLTRYREEFLGLDHLPLLDAAARVAARPAPLRWIGGLLLRRRMRPYWAGKPPALDALREDLECARDVKLRTEALAGESAATDLLGPRWNGGRANWEEITALLSWCDEVRAAVSAVEDNAGATLCRRMVAAGCDPTHRDPVRASARGVLDALKPW